MQNPKTSPFTLFTFYLFTSPFAICIILIVLASVNNNVYHSPETVGILWPPTFFMTCCI